MQPAPLPPAESRRFFLRVFPSIMLPMFLAVSDQTLVATALPAIAADFGETALLTWIVVAFLMMNALTTPVYGRMGDLVGRRRMMLIALSLVVLGASIAVTATRIEMLILGRTIQGLGGGGLMSLSQALIGQMVPLRDRGRYQGYLATVTSTATITGPLLGGVLTHYFGWRAALGISIPLALIAVLLALRLPVVPRRQAGGKFDFAGLALFAGAVLPVLFAIQQMQAVASGASGATLPALLFVLALVNLGLLWWRERRAANPLFPLGVLSQPAIWRCACVTATHGAAFVALVAFTPLYLRAARDLDIKLVGLLLLTLTVGVSMSSVVVGQIVSRTGRAAIIPSLGLSCLSLVVAGFAWFSPVIATPMLPLVYFAMSLCFGTVMSVMQMVVQHTAGPEHLGVAAASVQLSRALGAAIGTSVTGAVMFVALQSGDGTAAAAFADLLRGAALDPATAEGIRSQIGEAFRAAFLVIAGIVALGAARAWTIPVRRFHYGAED